MKRSLLDPLPRQLSTKALAALVALVVCGTGISVARFLESSRAPIVRAPAEVRAAPRVDEERPARAVRPSSRGTSTPNEASGISNGPRYTRGAGWESSSSGSTGSPCTSDLRDGEATFARPHVEGS